MSDTPDKSEKIHDPTPKRIRKAREEGNVFRSKEMVTVGMLVTGVTMLAVGIPYGFQALQTMATSMFQSASSTTLNVMSVPFIFMRIGMQMMRVALPFSMVMLVAAMGLNVMQSGWNLTLKPLMPKGNRISPLQGFKRIFSSKGLFEVGKSLAKISIVGPIAYWTITSKLPQILMLHQLPIKSILATAGGWILVLVAQMILVLFVLAAFDFAFEKWRYKEDLKMTTKEVKDEAKETEGDPQVKVKRRQIAREMARRPRLDHAVLQADVVITNPTHYAVALSYNLEESPAPRVLVKGIRKRALRIKELAVENDIPTIEDRPLARALYDSVPEQQEIPEELYPAVAAILAEIYRKRDGA
ncbi:MAG: flagellar biosynthesis protein FlhB [Rhodothermales bacterium]